RTDARPIVGSYPVEHVEQLGLGGDELVAQSGVSVVRHAGRLGRARAERQRRRPPRSVRAASNARPEMLAPIRPRRPPAQIGSSVWATTPLIRSPSAMGVAVGLACAATDVGVAAGATAIGVRCERAFASAATSMICGSG